MVSMGQIVDAVVLNIDKENKKLALGMKQLEPDPWQDLMRKYPVNSQHKGVVRNLTNFGVFVELEPGVDGLVHISDLSWTKKIRHPGEFVKKGEELQVIVLSIDPEQRRIALGHKQVNENPWDYFEEKYKVGQVTEAKIERIIEKGVIVELPDGVDGFVPISQLSFAPVRNISEYFEIGDLLPLKVVEFDKESKKIVLSVVENLRTRDRAFIDAYNIKHPVPNADKYDVSSLPPPEVLTGIDDFEGLEFIDEKIDNKAKSSSKTITETQDKNIAEPVLNDSDEDKKIEVPENINLAKVESQKKANSIANNESLVESEISSESEAELDISPDTQVDKADN
jgi:ribosomal protein S1